MENKGHFCYSCNEYFHDSNPNVKSHNGCKGESILKDFGICVDKREFNNFELTLKFNVDNNFCPVNKKYGTSGDRYQIAKTALWIINCAMSAIERAYDVDAPRRIEMEALQNNLHKQLREQLTVDECETLKIK